MTVDQTATFYPYTIKNMKKLCDNAACQSQGSQSPANGSSATWNAVKQQEAKVNTTKANLTRFNKMRHMLTQLTRLLTNKAAKSLSGTEKVDKSGFWIHSKPKHYSFVTTTTKKIKYHQITPVLSSKHSSHSHCRTTSPLWCQKQLFSSCQDGRPATDAANKNQWWPQTKCATTADHLQRARSVVHKHSCESTMTDRHMNYR